MGNTRILGDHAKKITYKYREHAKKRFFNPEMKVVAGVYFFLYILGVTHCSVSDPRTNKSRTQQDLDLNYERIFGSGGYIYEIRARSMAPSLLLLVLDRFIEIPLDAQWSFFRIRDVDSGDFFPEKPDSYRERSLPIIPGCHPISKLKLALIRIMDAVSDSRFGADGRNWVTEQLFFVLMQAEFYTKFSSSEGIVSWKTLLRELFYLSVLTDSSNFEDFQIASHYIFSVLVDATLRRTASSKECTAFAPARFRPVIVRIQKRVFFELARMTLADLKDGLNTVVDSRNPRVSLRIFLLEKYTAIIKGSQLLDHFKPDLGVLKSQLIRYTHRLDHIARSRNRIALLLSLVQDIEQGIQLLLGDFDQKNVNTDLHYKIE